MGAVPAANLQQTLTGRLQYRSGRQAGSKPLTTLDPGGYDEVHQPAAPLRPKRAPPKESNISGAILRS
jgi:hypothetical protein